VSKKLFVLTLCFVLVSVFMLYGGVADTDKCSSQTDHTFRVGNPSNYQPEGPRSTPTLIDQIDLSSISVYCFGLTYDWERDALWVMPFANENVVYAIQKTSPCTKVDSFTLSGAPTYHLGTGFAGGDVMYMTGYDSNIYEVDMTTGNVSTFRSLPWSDAEGLGFNAVDDVVYPGSWGSDQCTWAQPAQSGSWNTWGLTSPSGLTGAYSASISPNVLFTVDENSSQAHFYQHSVSGGIPNTTPDSTWDCDPGQTQSSTADMATDGQYVYIIDQGDPDMIWVYDVGLPPPPPPGNTLYVDDDNGDTTETYWETSFANLFYTYTKWVVADSGDVAPDSAAMADYTIVVWSTGGDYSSTLTATDTTEIGKYLNAGGKFWLSSQDVLYDIGSASWMHIAGWTNDQGITNGTGIDMVMSPLSFALSDGAFYDYTDLLDPDGTSWSSVVNDDYNDTSSVAMDTTVGLPYFLYFNAFGWENIVDEAYRDSMMLRVLTWMVEYPPWPTHDVGTQAIVWPPTIIPMDSTGNPSATYYNFGESTDTFDIHFTIDSSGVNLYDETAQMILPASSGSTYTYSTPWTAGPTEGIDYVVTAYTVMTSDTIPSNDTITQVTTTIAVSEWSQCADRPSAALCHATCYDPIDDLIYAIGGGDSTNYYNYNYCYDPTTDNWTTLTALPVSVNWIDASVCEWNRKIYIFGGFDGSVHNYNYIYDITEDSWSTGANLPIARMAGGQAIYNDSLIYMLGGYDGSGPSTNVQIYNTYTDSWTVGTPLTAANMMYGCAILGDTIWLVGGYDGSLYSTLYYGVIDSSNCETISWSTGSSLPGAGELYNNGATMMYHIYGGTGLLYMVGGFAGLYVSDITNEAWEYNVGLDTWTQLPNYPMTLARNDFLVSRTNGDTPEIYVNGGDNSGSWTPTAEMWKLSLYPAVAEEPQNQTLVFNLSRAIPNPVSNNATISYTTTQKGPVSLKIYDRSGRLIRTLKDKKNESAGQKTVYWDGKDNNHRPVSSGVYFYRLTAGKQSPTRKIVVIK
jgi:hypothetical protein